MLQSPEPKYSPNAAPTNSYTPVKPATSPMDQANIGRSLVIKGEVTGAESLFIDGRIEGTISVTGHRVTVGHNGNVVANIKAKEAAAAAAQQAAQAAMAGGAGGGVAHAEGVPGAPGTEAGQEAGGNRIPGAWQKAAAGPRPVGPIGPPPGVA